MAFNRDLWGIPLKSPTIYLYVSRNHSGRKNRIREPTSIKMPIEDFPEIGTHDWDSGECRTCGACLTSSSGEVYFYSTKEKATQMLDAGNSAEYPIACRDNVVKQVIE